jgi:hypothetical protein
MNNSEYFLNVLTELEEEANQIQGVWSGKESGVVEDRAMTASSMIDCINHLKKDINYLETL